MEQVLFVLFGGVALASSILAITRRNAVASAVWLVGTFFGLAGIFVLLEAYFVAVVQILVYAGAIMVLFLFVIMLLNLRRDDLDAGGRPKLALPGVLLSAAFLFLVGRAIVDAKRPGVVAQSASARLHLPAPLAPTSGDPLALTPAAPAPEPIRIPLSRREPAVAPLDDALRAQLTAIPSRRGPDAWAESGPRYRPRLFTGTLDLAGARREVAVVADVKPVHELKALQTRAVYVDRNGDGRLSPDESLTGLPDPWTAEDRELIPNAPFFHWDASAISSGGILHVDYPGGMDLTAAPDGAPDGSPFAIGKSLFDDWILPFEVTSLLLLGAIFGAVVLTKRRLA